jgi:uncharacterized protein YqjF (DUF2071 family)
MNDLLRDTRHRPWPIPTAPWVIEQSWQNLLFAHWPVAPDMLRSFVPAPLTLDVYGTDAYISITPFYLTDFRIRLLPKLPFASDFLEMNCRTYVTYEGRPGIFFFSLDAANPLAVLGAELTFGLPYFLADMTMARRGEWTHYSSMRTDEGDARFEGRYRATGPVFTAEPTTLEYFLAERYALYTVRGGHVQRGDIHHAPWRLQKAEADIAVNTVAAASGITLPERAPLVHYSARQDTIIWAPARAG